MFASKLTLLVVELYSKIQSAKLRLDISSLLDSLHCYAFFQKITVGDSTKLAERLRRKIWVEQRNIRWSSVFVNNFCDCCRHARRKYDVETSIDLFSQIFQKALSSVVTALLCLRVIDVFSLASYLERVLFKTTVHISLELSEITSSREGEESTRSLLYHQLTFFWE
jgi:hypothetical protein